MKIFYPQTVPKRVFANNFFYNINKLLMPEEGFEPSPRQAGADFESAASTYSATPACNDYNHL